jgi:DNA-binding CsgD family transcriptional regulator
MLLDREAELGLAAAAVCTARTGRGALMLVSGPLGIGRSALLDAIGELGVAQGVVRLRASAAPMERDFSLGVARQLLEPALRHASREALARWTSGPARHARTALDAGWLGGAEPDKTVLGGLTALIENIGRDQPILMLVDELQWADPATLHWLRHLGERLASMPVLLVCAVRQGDTLTEHPAVQAVIGYATHALRPRNFTLDNSRELIRQHYREEAEEAFVMACHTASGGNPLFLGALLADAASRGLHPTAEHAQAAAALRPSPLRHRLLLRLDAQSEQVRRMARAMAVLGDDAGPEPLSRLAELDTVGRDQALRHLSSLGLMTDRRRPRFVHPVVQEAVEEGMPLAERTAMHALAAELLHRAGRPPEQVAKHLMALTAPTYAWAIEVLRSAAYSAQSRGAPEAAARYLRRALLVSPPGSDRAKLLVDLGTSERSFAPSASVRHIAQAVTLLDEPVERAQAVVRLAPTAFSSTVRPIHELLREVADALGPDRLRGPDRELALRLEARIRQSALSVPVQLADSVTRLVGLGTEPSTGTRAERELLATLLGAATFANALPAQEVARLANRILEREPAFPAYVHTTLPMLVTNLVAADSIETLGSWLDAAQQNAAGRQTPLEQALIGAEQALVSLARGRVTEAKERALAAHDLAGAEHKEVFTVSAIALASVAIHTQDSKLAEWLLAGRYRAAEEPYLWSALTMMRAKSAARQGDLSTALSHFVDVGHRLEQCGWRNPVLLPWASSAALVHLRLGDLKHAAELSCQELEQARVWGAPAALGRALRVHSRIVEGPGSTELLLEAVDVLDLSANRYELCLALLEFGERCGPADVRGRAALDRAHAEAVECDAPWLARRTEARLAEAPPGTRATRGQLTPAERRVAELAASGLTNQVIADDLNITCRAVEKHLTNCYRKMSIKGRAVLAASLRELDQQSDSPWTATPY